MFLCGCLLFLFCTNSKVDSYNEMNQLFAPGLKPWQANKAVMANVCAAHDLDIYVHIASMDSEEKGVGSVEHNEKANGV